MNMKARVGAADVHATIAYARNVLSVVPLAILDATQSMGWLITMSSLKERPRWNLRANKNWQLKSGGPNSTRMHMTILKINPAHSAAKG